MSEQAPHVQLTVAEREVLLLLIEGCTPKQVAQCRGNSVRTIEWHVRRLYAKTGTSGQIQLGAWAAEHRACCLERGVADDDPRRFAG